MKNGVAGALNFASEFWGGEEILEEDNGCVFQYEKKGAAQLPTRG